MLNKLFKKLTLYYIRLSARENGRDSLITLLTEDRPMQAKIKENKQIYHQLYHPYSNPFVPDKYAIEGISDKPNLSERLRCAMTNMSSSP